MYVFISSMHICLFIYFFLDSSQNALFTKNLLRTAYYYVGSYGKTSVYTTSKKCRSRINRNIINILYFCSLYSNVGPSGGFATSTQSFVSTYRTPPDIVLQEIKRSFPITARTQDSIKCRADSCNTIANQFSAEPCKGKVSCFSICSKSCQCQRDAQLSLPINYNLFIQHTSTAMQVRLDV